jgi:ABC-type glycerol-3-phosphate transport system substrate-binding protein
MTGPNFLNIVKENAPAIFQITDVAPQFPTKSAYKDFSTMDLVVPRKSAHPKEAVDFATFMTNRVNQLALAQKAPVLPSVTEALQDPYFRKETSTDLIERARSISAHQLLTATQAYQIHPGQNEINERINYYVQMALLGKLDAQTAMLKAEKEINDLLKSK